MEVGSRSEPGLVRIQGLRLVLKTWGFLLLLIINSERTKFWTKVGILLLSVVNYRILCYEKVFKIIGLSCMGWGVKIDPAMILVFVIYGLASRSSNQVQDHLYSVSEQ